MAVIGFDMDQDANHIQIIYWFYSLVIVTVTNAANIKAFVGGSCHNDCLHCNSGGRSDVGII